MARILSPRPINRSLLKRRERIWQSMILSIVVDSNVQYRFMHRGSAYSRGQQWQISSRTTYLAYNSRIGRTVPWISCHIQGYVIDSPVVPNELVVSIYSPRTLIEINNVKIFIFEFTPAINYDRLIFQTTYVSGLQKVLDRFKYFRFGSCCGDNR